MSRRSLIVQNVTKTGVSAKGDFAKVYMTIEGEAGPEDMVLLSPASVTSTMLTFFVMAAGEQYRALSKRFGGANNVTMMNPPALPRIVGVKVGRSKRDDKENIMIGLEIQGGATLHLTLGPDQAEALIQNISGAIRKIVDKKQVTKH